MPPTTGGSTKGSSTRERTTVRPRNSARASSRDIGTPTSTHSSALVPEVCTLRRRAESEDSLVSRAPAADQSTRAAIAVRAAARTGRRARPAPGSRRAATSSAGEAVLVEDRLSHLAADQVDELLPEPGVLGSPHRGDRVDVHGLLRLGKGDPLDRVPADRKSVVQGTGGDHRARATLRLTTAG